MPIQHALTFFPDKTQICSGHPDNDVMKVVRRLAKQPGLDTKAAIFVANALLDQNDFDMFTSVLQKTTKALPQQFLEDVVGRLDEGYYWEDLGKG